jgi:FkbM family methyltransferase
MSFAHRVLKVAHRLAQNMLPADQYIWLARRAIPLMDPRRRNSGVTIERANDLFCARRSGSAFYFDSHFKLGRYLFREESASIGAWLLTKYSFGKVRIKPGDIVVEVGANVGEFTCAAAAIAARVLAIDPDPRPYRCLTLNVAGLPNVSAYNLALGDFDGHSTLYVASARSDSSLIEPTARWTSRIHIDVCTLATLMSRAKIERIDFLKLEAE